MSGTRPARRSDTRQRIQEVALELFAEQGYEKTSLREIAERLDVTKAALYYHFKTKEDIISSIFEDLTRPVDELVSWAQGQPPTLATKREVLRRYGANLAAAQPLFRFMHENQATLRDLTIRDALKERMGHLLGLLVPEDAPLPARLRATTAFMSLHAAVFALGAFDGPDTTLDERLAAALEIAEELITSAHTLTTA
ncbi:TetR/AcrR family transcriptional regulator [Streptomyces millisiae]|uniref:Helix-turn-helix domain-containing protein n=1 Tax=Streptomyces millisiae TaxID=3075542 RepID=A0ABU2LU62_9ACTN|nr:helix-turn-helix domain-containing protein [Streptomyces sp. DSM 44918]MDT0321142.1 helix-turn-helix domain-containing protein [Streptomyces sp. DSM 44918]